MSRTVTIALAGNPNSGKTTIFNNITGARQHVGNYPGVTVEKKEGRCTHKGVDINVVDLPGTYSLTAHSVEELIARNFVIDERPDVVVDVIDSSNLERNLYLAVQFMELGVPLVLAFNMSDMAEARGMAFDLKQLSELLGAPIVCTVGHKRRGTAELLDAVVRRADGREEWSVPDIHYGPEIENELGLLEKLVKSDDGLSDGLDARWLAIKLLEGDEEILSRVSNDELRGTVSRSTAHLERVLGDAPEILIADQRYGFISGACQEAVRSTVEARHTVSDKIDAVLTNRLLGLPIFALMMYLVFQLTFAIGNPCVDFLDGLVSGDLAGSVNHLWPKGSDSLARSLIVDGIIGGVGSVLVFVPLIMLLFFAIAILEDSGYMARAAFIMDRLMHKIGLHGKSFVPMLIGFGCSVPAIMATRTLESRRDRMTTMMVVPLMSCGARLPIYMLIIPVFFPVRWRTPMLWLIYMIGIALAIVCAKLLRSTVFKGASTPFVMELPPYRMPTLRGLLIHMWQRVWMYVRKAGTVIFAFSVLLWVANTFPRGAHINQASDVQVEQARGAYVQQLGRVNQALGLPDDSALIQEFVAVELEHADQQEKFWAHEAGFSKADDERSAAIDRLTASDNGGVLRTFLSVRDQVLDSRARFDQAVKDGQLEPNKPEWRQQQRRRDKEMAGLAEADPKACRAALTYLDDIKSGYDAKIKAIDGRQQSELIAYSAAGRVGRVLAVVMKPLGFDWKIGTALVGALGAKEVFVSQMGIVYSLGAGADEKSESLRTKLRAEYTPLIAFCIMLFCLVSAPCMAAIAMTIRESGSWKWGMFQFGGLTILAYIVTAIVYQVGSLLS